MKRTFRTEFPDFGELPFDPSTFGFRDDSWCNDICPSFFREPYKLWIDYADPEQREMGGVRYAVALQDEDQEWVMTVFEGDSLNDLTAFLRSLP